MMNKKLSENQLAVLHMACTHGNLTQGCATQSDYGGRASTLLSLRRLDLLDVMNTPTDRGRVALTTGRVVLTPKRPRQPGRRMGTETAAMKNQPDNGQDSQRLALNLSNELGLLPARWYCVSRDGLATLCLNEANAREMVAECAREYTRQAPYRAVLMGDIAAERERWTDVVSHAVSELEALDDETAQCQANALRELLRLNANAFHHR